IVACEYNAFGVEDIDEIGKRHTQKYSRALKSRLCSFIPLSRKFHCLAGREFFDAHFQAIGLQTRIFQVILDYTRVRDVGLQAARVAAFTEPPFGGDRSVAEFAGTPECSAIDIAVDDYAASDGHLQEMMIWLALAKEFLINCQAIDIIIEKDEDSEAIF